MAKRLAFIILLAVIAGATPVIARGPSVIHVSDYMTTPGDTTCANGVGWKLQQAIDAWVGMQRAGDGGELDLGAGCYLTGRTIFLGDVVGGKPVFGHVHGAGPSLTVIKQVSPIRTIEVDDFMGGSIEGFSVSGPGIGSGTGIVFGARHIDLGTCCSTIQDITVEKFKNCFQFGDDVAPFGASAELLIQSTTANYCSVGYQAGGWNTGDLVFQRANASFSTKGWHNCYATGCAFELNVIGGGATNDYLDFELYATNASITGFRDEAGPYTTPRVVLGGAGQAKYTLTGNLFSATSEPIPIVIAISGTSVAGKPGNALKLSQNFLAGRVQASDGATIISEQNGIVGPQPFELLSGASLREQSDCVAVVPGQECQALWPDTP